MARCVSVKHSVGPQNQGERAVIKFLWDRLPPIPAKDNLAQFGSEGPEYVIIPNVEIPDSANRFLEIDGIVVAPHAVYVLEVKDWGPRIEGNDFEWYLNEDRIRKNPHRTLNYKCRVLKSLVENQSPDLRKVWFQGVVVIARDNVILDLSGNCETSTFRLDERLASFLQDPTLISADKPLQKGVIARYQKEIIQIIIGKGRAAKDVPLIIEGYKVVEQLFAQDGLVEYLARAVHGEKLGSLKRLRVFTLPVYAGDAERKLRETRILRDYEALESVGTHPNIVSLKGFYKHEADQIVEVLDWAEEGTLRNVMAKGTLTVEQKINIVAGIASGLKAAHQKGVIHRDLRPENILISAAGPQIMNFDKAFISGGDAETVWQTVYLEMDRRYLPPELALPKNEYDVFESSDLYSLGVVFYELLCGDIPYLGPEEFEATGGKLPNDKLPSKRVPGLPSWIDELISKMYVGDVGLRYQIADAFLTDLRRRLQHSPVEESSPKITVTPSEGEELDPNRVFQPGEKIGDYRIIKHIKTGGFAQVYSAMHVLHEKEYAIKVNNQSVPLSALIDEFNILNQLDHPNIVRVHWSGQLPGSRYYIAMEYLKGEALSHYIWGSKKLTVSQAIELAKQVVGALRYLHEGAQKVGALAGKVLYHRDVKPNNIIWVPDRGYVLIDFNIAKEATQSDTFAGTGRYIAPDLISGTKIRWDDSGDTFALGVTLYELICGTHPYPNDEPHLNVQPIDPRETPGGKDLSEAVAKFLVQAVQSKERDRFQTAKAMEDAIVKVETGELYKAVKVPVSPASFSLEEKEKHLKNYNPFVKRLRRLFSQAEHSNVGTRGLDEFAKDTYIQTKLDEQLIPAILKGEYKLVIITGNAGDGKTALIQQLENSADNLRLLPSGNGSTFQINAVPFESKYDGSQDEGGIPNDRVLEDFLKSFKGLTDFSKASDGRILAINEGRLMEFLGDPRRGQDFGHLYEVVDQYFALHGEKPLPKQVLLINLNWRSVVANGGSLLEKQLQSLLRPEFWQACSGCAFNDKCFIYYNAKSLSDKAAGSEIRNRLSELFVAVHLRRRLHITMRDLRSALSFLICRDHGCEDIPKMSQILPTEFNSAIEYLQLSYWNITDELNESGPADRLVRLLGQLDVGQVAQPGQDRDLHFLPFENIQFLGMAERKSDFMDVLLMRLQNAFQEYLPDDDGRRQKIRRLHRLIVRKTYFEGRDPRATNRNPYGKNVLLFKAILSEEPEQIENARGMLIEAISLSEGCRNQKLVNENICIRASDEQDPRWSSFRLFPESQFEIVVPKIGSLGRFLEHSPDMFILRHQTAHEAVLEVDLDLFDLMAFVAKGFSPSLNDLQGRFVELISFKNTLQRLPFRSVLMTKDHQEFYKISATKENNLVLEKV